MTFRAGKVAMACAGLLACGAVRAARPMVADDATILAAGQCQVEAWREHHPGQTQYWAAPHCNFGTGWEFVAALGELDPGPAHHSAGGVLVAKTVFRQLKPDDWAVGLSLSDQVAPGGPFSRLAVNVPVTISVLHDRMRIDLNAGWMSQRDSRTGATWAVGAEWSATSKLGLTLEAYGIGHAYAQAGLRYVALPARLVLDAALGDRISLHGKERYFALGLTVSGLSLR